MELQEVVVFKHLLAFKTLMTRGEILHLRLLLMHLSLLLQFFLSFSFNDVLFFHHKVFLVHFPDMLDQLALVVTNEFLFVFLTLLTQKLLGIPVLLEVKFCVKFLVAVFTFKSCLGNCNIATFLG